MRPETAQEQQDDLLDEILNPTPEQVELRKKFFDSMKKKDDSPTELTFTQAENLRERIAELEKDTGPENGESEETATDTIQRSTDSTEEREVISHRDC